MNDLCRIVTGHDADGKAVAVIDGTVINVKRGNGATLRHLRNTDATPAEMAVGLDVEDVGLRDHVTPRRRTARALQ